MFLVLYDFSLLFAFLFTSEHGFSREYGLPSSHTMCNTVMPLMVGYFSCQEMSKNSLFDSEAVCLFGFVALWILSLALGRVYLGVHTPLDVFVGFVCGVLYFFAWMLFYDQVDWYITRSPYCTQRFAFSLPVFLSF